MRESYNSLKKIYDGLEYNEDRAICGGQLSTFLEAILRVNEAPTVDAVEVVRCKDCVYYKPGKHFKEINFCQRLPYYAEKGGLNVSDDDFCSYGERRDGDG